MDRDRLGEIECGDSHNWVRQQLRALITHVPLHTLYWYWQVIVCLLILPVTTFPRVRRLAFSIIVPVRLPQLCFNLFHQILYPSFLFFFFLIIRPPPKSPLFPYPPLSR